jgi:ribosome-binding factor A
MSNPGHRKERLADQLRNEAAQIISEELQDPRIRFVTVTRVEVGARFDRVRIFVSVLGDEKAQCETMEGLHSATGFVRREITQRLGLRRAPQIDCVLDHGPEDAIRIDTLLSRLKPPQ